MEVTPAAGLGDDMLTSMNDTSLDGLTSAAAEPPAMASNATDDLLDPGCTFDCGGRTVVVSDQSVLVRCVYQRRTFEACKVRQ